MGGVEGAGVRHERADVPIVPEKLGIEEVDYDAYVAGVERFVTDCMNDALDIVKNAVKDAQGNLENSIKAIKDEDVLGTWDPLEQIINYLPMQIKGTQRQFMAIEMHRRMMRDLREWMKRSGKEKRAKARFYHKGDIHFWDPEGKTHPVDLLNQYLGNQQQAMQAQQAQPPPMPPAPPGMEVG